MWNGTVTAWVIAMTRIVRPFVSRARSRPLSHFGSEFAAAVIAAISGRISRPHQRQPIPIHTMPASVANFLISLTTADTSLPAPGPESAAAPSAEIPFVDQLATALSEGSTTDVSRPPRSESQSTAEEPRSLPPEFIAGAGVPSVEDISADDAQTTPSLPQTKPFVAQHIVYFSTDPRLGGHCGAIPAPPECTTGPEHAGHTETRPAAEQPLSEADPSVESLELPALPEAVQGINDPAEFVADLPASEIAAVTVLVSTFAAELVPTADSTPVSEIEPVESKSAATTADYETSPATRQFSALAADGTERLADDSTSDSDAADNEQTLLNDASSVEESSFAEQPAAGIRDTPRIVEFLKSALLHFGETRTSGGFTIHATASEQVHATPETAAQQPSETDVIRESESAALLYPSAVQLQLSSVTTATAETIDGSDLTQQLIATVVAATPAAGVVAVTPAAHAGRPAVAAAAAAPPPLPADTSATEVGVEATTTASQTEPSPESNTTFQLADDVAVTAEIEVITDSPVATNGNSLRPRPDSLVAWREDRSPLTPPVTSVAAQPGRAVETTPSQAQPSPPQPLQSQPPRQPQQAVDITTSQPGHSLTDAPLRAAVSDALSDQQVRRFASQSPVPVSNNVDEVAGEPASTAAAQPVESPSDLPEQEPTDTDTLEQRVSSESSELPANPDVSDQEPTSPAPTSTPAPEAAPATVEVTSPVAAVAATEPATPAVSGLTSESAVVPVTGQVAASVVRRLQSWQETGEPVRHIAVRLDPPELGALRIQVRTADDGLHMHVEAAEDVTLEMLSTRVPEIEQLLRSQEIDISRITIQRMESEFSTSTGSDRSEGQAREQDLSGDTDHRGRGDHSRRRRETSQTLPPTGPALSGNSARRGIRA